MREMSKWNSLSDMENGVVPAGVKLDDKIFPAGPGHFGKEISASSQYTNTVAFVNPVDACTPIENKKEVEGKFGIAKRGQCTFAQKVRHMQAAGVSLAIIIDNIPDSTHESTALFAMSGDGKEDIDIPAVFLFSQEGRILTDAYTAKPDLTVTVGELKAMKAHFENTCDDGNCETVLETPNVSNDKESFDHLKKVLSQLAAQFELSLSHEEQKIEESANVIISKNKYISEDGNLEGPPDTCTTKTDAKTTNEGIVGTAEDITDETESKKEQDRF